MAIRVPKKLRDLYDVPTPEAGLPLGWGPGGVPVNLRRLLPSMLGIYVGTSPPLNAISFDDWLAGAEGFWAFWDVSDPGSFEATPPSADFSFSAGVPESAIVPSGWVVLWPPAAAFGFAAGAPTLEVIAPIFKTPPSADFGFAANAPVAFVSGAVTVAPPSADFGFAANVPTTYVVATITLSPPSAAFGFAANVPTMSVWTTPGLLDFETTSLTPESRTGAYVESCVWDGVKGTARDSSVAHGGTYSMKVVSAAGGSPVVQLARALTLPASGTVSFERWFRFSTFSADGGFNIFALAPDNPVTAWRAAAFYQKNTGTPELEGILVYGPAYVQTRVVGSLVAGNWYRVAVDLNCTTNEYTTTVYNAAGTQLGQVVDHTPNANFSGQSLFSIVGLNANGQTAWVDNVVDGV